MLRSNNMAGKESYFWHKVHSLTGIIPVGFYMVQHLVLNSFSLAGRDYYNGVIQFFDKLPKHILMGMEVFVVWLPLLFHAVYGMFIVSRAKPYLTPVSMKFTENRYYMSQRWSGIFLFAFLVYHFLTTTVLTKVKGAENVIYYDNWAGHLLSMGGLILVVYVVGVIAASYHLSYGIWNFCIRWGITISEAAQMRMAKFAAMVFVALSVLGCATLAGFFIHNPDALNRDIPQKTSPDEPSEGSKERGTSI